MSVTCVRHGWAAADGNLCPACQREAQERQAMGAVMMGGIGTWAGKIQHIPNEPEVADPPRDVQGMLSWLKAHPTQPHLVVVLCGHALFGIRGPNGVLEAYLCRIEREGLTVA